MRRRRIRPFLALAAAGALLCSALPALAASMLHRDMVELIDLSEQILVGQVLTVTDGVDGNVPYTEVTMRVAEKIRGDVPEYYSFRQFGLLAPRDMGNGKINLNVSPDGWPTFAAGEQVVVFLYKEAAWTGLRTTVGLLQGKFNVENGQVANAIRNENLFTGISVASGLTASESKCLGSTVGEVPVKDFLGIVRKAVTEQWIEQGVMQHEQ